MSGRLRYVEGPWGDAGRPWRLYVNSPELHGVWTFSNYGAAVQFAARRGIRLEAT